MTIQPLTQRQEGRTRSASSAIQGYMYQFERSVVEILKLSCRGDEVRIEGVEDIDLWGDHPKIIQIKYLESTKWSLSRVRTPVYEMLSSFAEGLEVTYVLHIYVKKGNPPKKFDIDMLKECLTTKDNENNLKLLYKDFEDRDLQRFVDFFKIESGEKLSELKKQSVKEISRALDCDKEEAEILHRMRAIQFLHEIAIKRNPEERVVTQDDLIRFLNIRKRLYSRWHQEEMTYDVFLKTIKKELEREGFSDPNTNRGVAVTVDDKNVAATCELALELAEDLCTEDLPDGKRKKRTVNAKPWTLIIHGSKDHVLTVKRELLNEKIHFNDGYEEVQFSLEHFTSPPVVNSVERGKLLKKASHTIRIIGDSSVTIFGDEASKKFKLGLLLTLGEATEDDMKLSKTKPISIDGLSISDLTKILRDIMVGK